MGQYQIICRKGIKRYQIVDKSIVVENSNWEEVTNVSLQKMIGDIHLTGIKNNPKISANAEGIQLSCDAMDADTKYLILCNNIDAPLSVLDEVQRLHNEGPHSSKEVAIVRIGPNKYNIVCEIGDNESVKIDSKTIKLIQSDW